MPETATTSSAVSSNEQVPTTVLSSDSSLPFLYLSSSTILPSSFFSEIFSLDSVDLSDPLLAFHLATLLGEELGDEHEQR
mmetsp:Transcript_38/g.60  ORF Transcript_38/g.60 Transcript_38/m.60 type:complete len:80 (+) Transcript_38:2040-2279(+)